jgi:hypothetical protein
VTIEDQVKSQKPEVRSSEDHACPQNFRLLASNF